MQKTINYQMKKPDLTDSPPDITVLNENFDIIDEKLFAVIKAWEDFKANGGEVGGSITLPSGSIENTKGTIKLVGNDGKQVYLSAQNSIVKGVPKCEIVLIKNDNNDGYELRPTNHGKDVTALGGQYHNFKDIWLSGFSKSANGYTKLPNGMILQWGTVTLPATTSSNTFSLPLTFPITNLCAYVSIFDQGNISSSSACRLLNFNTASIQIANSLNVGMKATYFCIGY